MANQISLNFPDETYSSSNKPDTATLKTDLNEIESKHNALDTASLYLDGTKAMTGDLDMDSNTIENLKAPSNDNDAARKIDGNPVGTVLEFAGSSLPSGYLWCRGAEVSRSTYSALFTTIGTTFGAGDGSTTFNLPDKRDRSAVGSGTTYTLGETFGATTVTLVEGNLPSHSHTIAHTHIIDPPNTGTTSNGNHSHYVNGEADTGISSSMLAQSSSNQRTVTIPAAGAHTHTVNIAAFISGGSNTTNSGDTGSGTAVDIVNPGIGMNFIIKY